LSEIKPFTIDRFRGVNKSETETLLELGEASDLSNWIITDDEKLSKQSGYVHLNAAVAGKKVNDAWYGTLNGVKHFLFARGGKVYKLNLSTGAETEIGTIVDAYPTTFFVTNNTVYILDGTEFYSWNGTTFQTVSGYVPTAFTASPPSGGGTILEGLNYLTGKKSMKYSGNATATIYQLNETAIASVDSVTVNSVLKTVGTDYTVDLANGKVTFVSAPPTGVNNVIITWTKTIVGDRQLITNNKHYGGSYYARFWLFGNPNHKNTRYPSGVTMAGASDPTYWPKFADSDVGEYAITDIKTQYDKQLIWTDGDSAGASAWYSTNETFTDPNTGIVTVLFPLYPINAKVGNIAPGQVQIILNNPFTLWKGVFQWVSTYVMNEKNAEWLSKRIQRDLDPLDLSKAITWDWDDRGLYYLAIGKRIWVYNYRVDAWYILDLPHEPTCFITAEKEFYFGTTDGQIMRFDDNVGTFDGALIDAYWNMGFYNFTVDWLRKFIQRLFVSILPFLKTHIDITYETDRSNQSETLTAEYALSSFDTWDFSDFSFETNYSPQPFKFKIRAKKIDYFKLKIRNNGTDGATVLSITLPTRTGGEVKRR
jgi:hypothetical protein